MKHVNRIWPFVLADNKLAEEYLEKQAAKGLILDGFGGWGFIASYRVEKPQQRTFCIDGFKGNWDEQGHYLRMAKDAGWKYAAELPGHIFFISEEGQTPIPTQTDFKEEYLQIRKSLWSLEMPVGIVLLAFFILMAALDPTGFLLTIVESPQILCAYIFGTIGFVKALLFYVKSSLAIRRNIPISEGNWKAAMFWGYIRALTGLASFTLMIVNGFNTAVNLPEEGIWSKTTGLYVAILGTIIFIYSGVRSKGIDDLGRTVTHTDEDSKRLKKVGKALIIVGMIIIFLA